MKLDQSHHTLVLQQTCGQTSSESLPEPCLAWSLLGILVFRLLYGTALPNSGLFFVEHSTLQRWFDRIGQKSFPTLLYLNWACGPSESLPTLLLRRDLAHPYHLFLLVQVDLLDLLDQEVLGVHKRIWVPSVFFSLGEESVEEEKSSPSPSSLGSGSSSPPLPL